MGKWKPEVGKMYYFPLIHGEVGGPMPALWQDSEVDNEKVQNGRCLSDKKRDRRVGTENAGCGKGGAGKC